MRVQTDRPNPTEQALLTVLARNRGELDATALARLLARLDALAADRPARMTRAASLVSSPARGA